MQTRGSQFDGHILGCETLKEETVSSVALRVNGVWRVPTPPLPVPQSCSLRSPGWPQTHDGLLASFFSVLASQEWAGGVSVLLTTMSLAYTKLPHADQSHLWRMSWGIYF